MKTKNTGSFSWIEKVLSRADGVPSSKRLCGFIGFCVCQVIILFVALFSVVFSKIDLDILDGLFTTDVWASAALLGVECVTGSINRNVNVTKESKSKETDEC